MTEKNAIKFTFDGGGVAVPHDDRAPQALPSRTLAKVLTGVAKVAIRRKVQKEFGNPTSTRTTCCPNYTIRVRHHNTRFQLMRWLRRKRPNLQRAETEENLSKTLGYTMGQTRLVQDGGPPVGPSQRLSKIQPQQAKAIEEKQAKAVQQYTGAIQVLEEEGNREQGNQAQSKHDKQAAEQQGPSGVDFEALKWSSSPAAEMTEKNAIKFTFDGGGVAVPHDDRAPQALPSQTLAKVLTGVADGDQDQDHARHPVAVTSEGFLLVQWAGLETQEQANLLASIRGSSAPTLWLGLFESNGRMKRDEALFAEDPSCDIQALEYGEQEAYHTEQC
ncbi:unnamed protein product, partial [Symbiodinium pilosum]